MKFLEEESFVGEDESSIVHAAVEECSSITNLLIALSNHLNQDDEIGAELIKDFAVMFAEHENEQNNLKVN